MKKLLILLVLVLGILWVPGCSNEPFTVGESAEQVYRRDAQITNLQFRMLLEDWDYIWLYDRNVSMSPWHVWVGI